MRKRIKEIKKLSLKNVKKRYIVAAIFAVLFGGYVSHRIHIQKIWDESDRIVIVSRNDGRLLPEEKVECYAIAGKKTIKIPDFWVDVDVEHILQSNEACGKVYLVGISYNKYGNTVFVNDTAIPHPYSKEYVVTVDIAGKIIGRDDDPIVLSKDEEQFLLKIAEQFFDFKQEYHPGDHNWTSKTGDSYGLTGFAVYVKGDKVEIVSDKGVFNYDDGKLIENKIDFKYENALVIWK